MDSEKNPEIGFAIWLSKNIKWIVSTIVFVVINYFVIIGQVHDNQAALKARPTKEGTRTIVARELTEKLSNYFPNVSGKVLETKYDEILRRLDSIEKKIDKESSK